MIEVLKQALKALEANDQLINGNGTKGGLVYCMDGYYSDCFDVDPINKQTDEAIAAIKEALAQPEQEPSGHFLDFAYSDSIAYVHVYDQFRKGQQFYKAPPQRTWVGLTDVEIDYLLVSTAGENEETHISFARAIEAKLKELNT